MGGEASVRTFQVLDNSSKAVSMGGNKDPLPFLDLRDDFIIPEWQSSGNGVLQTLTAWELVLRQISIAAILGSNNRGPIQTFCSLIKQFSKL